MHLWRKILAFLGVNNDVRVRVRAADIDVVLTGEPTLVRAVTEAVKKEILRRSVGTLAAPHRERSMLAYPVSSAATATTSAMDMTDNALVLQPSELDDEDSPYAIPEHRTVAQQMVADDLETPGESALPSVHFPTEESAESDERLRTESKERSVGSTRGRHHTESHELDTNPAGEITPHESETLPVRNR